MMEVDHIGYAVADIRVAANEFARLGFSQGDVIEDVDRNISICFVRSGTYVLELVSPLDRGLPSPVDQHLRKVKCGPYHVCYVTDDLEADVERLSGRGFRVTAPPAAAIAFGGRRVVFLYSLALGLVELVERASAKVPGAPGAR